MSEAAPPINPLLGASIRVPADVVFREFPTETVVLNLQTGKYHGLNPTAGEMFTALDETESVDAAAQVISERHDVDLARVRQDICELCELLDERGLIVIERAESA
jgi:Coenzyme PQQ synthesis protein D (PqqD)